MDECFINITPTSLSFKNAELSDLSYKNARLELTLICPAIKSEVKLSFDWIHSFRVTDEGDLLGMSGIHGINQTGIYRVVNSAYFAWFWICPYISRHLLSLNPSLAHCRRYSRGER